MTAACTPVQAPAPEVSVEPRPSQADKTTPTVNPLDELDSTLLSLRPVQPAPVSEAANAVESDMEGDAVSLETATVQAVQAADAAYYAALSREIAALRTDVARLEGQLTVYLTDYVAALRDENLQLQREIHRLSMAQQSGMPNLPARPAVPGRPFAQVGPDTFVIGANTADEAITPTQASEDEVSEQNSVKAIASSGGLNYAIVKEWGRTPLEAARLEGNVPSLKGMICTVPPNTTEVDALALGRQLRVEYNEYQNINVAVFDDPEAAAHYADTNAFNRNPIVNIVKFPEEGRDDILVRRGDVLVKVAPDGTAMPVTASVSAGPPNPAEDDPEIALRAQALLERLQGKPLMKAPEPVASPDVVDSEHAEH